MPLSALSLVLLAGLIHALWNIVAKKSGGDLAFMALTAVVMMIFWAPLGLYLGIEEVPRWGALQWSLVLGSAVLHIAYFGILLRGYRLADLTVVYPLARGSGPLLSSTVALLFLGERLSGMGLLGMVSVVFGVMMIAGGPALWRQAHDPARQARIRTGVFYGLLTGTFIAGYTVIDGYAVKVAGMSPILLDYMGNIVRLLLLAPILLPRRIDWGALWASQSRAALFIGIISPVSYVMVLYAMQVAPLSHVAPAREVSMLFAALLGGHLLGESDRGLRLLGALGIALGVMLLGMS